MNSRLIAAMIAAAVCVPIASAEAQVRVPRVYGYTGRPYGPTQAHYQYHRQYGQPWHGYGGYTVAPSQVVVAGGFPWWGGYAPAYGYSPGYFVAPPVVASYAPGLSFYGPGVSGGFGVYGTPGAYWPYADPSLVQQTPQPFASSPLEDAWRENLDRWGPNLPAAKPDPVTMPVAPSSPEAQ